MANNERYSTVSVALHWLVALLIIAALETGLGDDGYENQSTTKVQYYSYHKWIGVTVLALVALRLLNRLLSSLPDYAHMSVLQQKAASYTHLLLYVLMFAVPLSGYFYTCAAGYPVVYLGLLNYECHRA